jgi:hypothetical protein
MDQEFLKDVQNFIANSFTASIIQKMAARGALKRIQGFLKGIDLAQISESDPAQYGIILDSLTQELMQAQAASDRKKWGMGRKCLNLFFRDALYNFYLRSAYNLQKFEAGIGNSPRQSRWQKTERGKSRSSALAICNLAYSRSKRNISRNSAKDCEKPKHP